MSENTSNTIRTAVSINKATVTKLSNKDTGVTFNILMDPPGFNAKDSEAPRFTVQREFSALAMSAISAFNELYAAGRLLHAEPGCHLYDPGDQALVFKVGYVHSSYQGDKVSVSGLKPDTWYQVGYLGGKFQVSAPLSPTNAFIGKDEVSRAYRKHWMMDEFLKGGRILLKAPYLGTVQYLDKFATGWAIEDQDERDAYSQEAIYASQERRNVRRAVKSGNVGNDVDGNIDIKKGVVRVKIFGSDEVQEFNLKEEANLEFVTQQGTFLERIVLPPNGGKMAALLALVNAGHPAKVHEVVDA